MSATLETTLEKTTESKTPTTPAPLTAIRKIGIIGLGGPGSEKILRIARSIKPDKYPLSLMVGHTDVSDLRSKFPLGDKVPVWLKRWRDAEKHDAIDPQRFTVLELGKTGDGARADPKVGEAATRAEKDAIKAFLNGNDLNIIMGALGGGTGSGGLPVIAQWINQSKKPGIAIVSMPFKSEGAPRGAVAAESLQKLTASIRTFVFYAEGRPSSETKDGKPSSNSSQRVVNKNVDLSSLFADMNEHFMTRVILTMRKLDQRAGAVMVADFSDNTKLCLEPGLWFCSSCDLPMKNSGSPSSKSIDQLGPTSEGQSATPGTTNDQSSKKGGEINIDDVTQELLWGNPYHDFNFTEMTNCILMFQGPIWWGSRIDSLTEKILNVVGDEPARKKVDIKTAYNPHGTPGVAFIAVGGGPAFERIRSGAGKGADNIKNKSIAAKAVNGTGVLDPASQPSTPSAPPPMDTPPIPEERMENIYVYCTPHGNSCEVPVPVSIAAIWNTEKEGRRKRAPTRTDADLAEILNPYIAKRYPGQKFFGTAANHDHPLLGRHGANGAAASQSVEM